MHLVYIIACCIILMVVANPSEGSVFSWGKKKEDGEKKVFEVGLVSTKKLSPSSQVNSAQVTSKSQDEATNQAKQAQGNKKPRLVTDPNTQGSGALKAVGPVVGSKPLQLSQSSDQSRLRTETTVTTSPVRPNIQRPPAPVKPSEPINENVEQKNDQKAAQMVDQQKKLDDEKLKDSPLATALMAASSSLMAATKTRKDEKEKLRKQSGDLKTELVSNPKDESLEDILGDLLKVARRRVKIKIALLVYGILNFVLFVAQHAGSMITPPVGKSLYYVDMVTKTVMRKPLDDWFGDFQKANAEAVGKYIKRHPEEFRRVKKGKRVTIKTPEGEHSFKVLTTRPGEPLLDSDLHIVDAGPLEVFRTMYNLKR